MTDNNRSSQLPARACREIMAFSIMLVLKPVVWVFDKWERGTTV